MDRHVAKTLLGWACALAIVCGALPALAQPVEEQEGRDYDVSSDDWNGLSGLFLLARTMDVELIYHDALDYGALSLDEPLVVLYPSQGLDVGSVERYVLAGGRVLVADDFGASGELLERLDLARIEPVRGTLPHDEFLDNNPALPIVRATGVHGLLEGVEAVVANHPSVLYNVGGPVLGFNADGGLVYDMNLGKGKVVVMGDSSMFINHMLTIADNQQLARNALRYVCRGALPCRVHLYVGEFAQGGTYGAPDDPFSKSMTESVSSFNDAIESLLEALPADALLYYLGILFAGGLIVYLFTIFPARATRPYSAYLSDVRERLNAPQSEFDWNLARFDVGAGGMNYALPVAILKEIFEEIFLEGLGVWEMPEGERRPDVQALGDLFERKHLDMHGSERARRVRAQLVELLATLARVPTRHKVFLDSDVYFSERDLLKIHARCIEVLELMGLREEYERRTRTDA
jgi:hypothetical protein